MFRASLSVLLIAAAAHMGWTQSAADFAPVTQLIEDSISKVGPNCGLIIMRNDSVLYKHYFGAWSDATYRPIASGSKMPSMALIMTLVESGRMHLDDTVQHYLPSFAGKPVITLRQLMSHTSGLPDSSDYIGDNSLTLAQAVDSIGLKTPMAAAPGSAFIYTGVGMHVAGRMAEIASGMRWDSLFNLKLAQPLGLTHTDYLGLGATTNFRIAGGMGTTLPDYAKFLNAMLKFGRYDGGRILDSNSVALMQIDQTRGAPLVYTPYARDPMHADIRYGFGTWLETVNPRNGIPIEVGDQGAFGFSPWIDRCRNICGVFFVLRPVAEIQFTYEALRAQIERIVPRTLAQPVIHQEGGKLYSSAASGNQWLKNGLEIDGATDVAFSPGAEGDYSVRATDKCGCDTVSAAFKYQSAGIASMLAERVHAKDAPVYDVEGRRLSQGRTQVERISVISGL